ncbi:MAG: hypothetical protein PUB10_03925 [Clostridiales bacterium]|nr:hypothetical protein [Clostridiales bacterium]
MKKVTGFILIWIAVGMVLGLFIKNAFILCLLIALFLLIGYHLFCC